MCGDAFQNFVRDNWSAWYRMTSLMVSTHHAEVDDILQEALVRLHRKWAKVSHLQHPEAYMKRIITNAVIDASRSRDSRKRAERRLLHERMMQAEQPTDAYIDPLDGDLWRAVCALPPRQRAVIVLRYYEGHTEAEIARILQCAPGTVKSHAHTALSSLRTKALPGSTNQL